MLAMFKSSKAIKVGRDHTIPAEVWVTVLGVDGGTFVIRNLNNGQVSNIARELFSTEFVRWN